MLALTIALIILTLVLCLLFNIIYKIAALKGFNLLSKTHRLIITPGCVAFAFSILTIILFKIK